MRGIERKIKVLKDCKLRTYYEEHTLIKGEVKVVRFKNKQVFEALLEFRNFRLATSEEKVERNIPVIFPDINENGLVVVEQGKISEQLIEVLPLNI